MDEIKKEKKEEKKEEKKGRFELIEVPTQTGVYVRDNNTEEVLEDKEVMVQILNRLDKLVKSLG